MRKVIALTVCFGFLLLAVPSLNAAPKKAPKFNFFERTITFISPIFSFLPNSYVMKDLTKFKRFTGEKVRVTGTLDSDRICDGD